MLGSDKARSYCLEMICADFLAGARASDGDSEILLNALLRTFKMLDEEQQLRFLTELGPYEQKLAS